MKKSKNLKEGVYLPFSNLAIKTQINILKSLLDKYEKEDRSISYKDIGDIHASRANVSSSLPFYANIGWLKKSGTKYTPCKNLIRYFKGLDKEEPRKELSQLLLQNCGVAEGIKFFIKQKSKSDREGTIKYLGTRFGLLKKDRKSLNKLLDLLIFLEVLEVDSDRNLFLKEAEEDTAPTATPQERQKEKVESKTLPIFATQEKVNVCVGIMLTPEMTDEQMRKSIRIVLEEIRKLRSSK